MRRKKSTKRSITRNTTLHTGQCDLSTKKSKLHTKGVVKWPDIDLTPRPRVGQGYILRRKPVNADKFIIKTTTMS